MIFELDAMMASEGPPDGSTRLDSREALSAPTLAIPRSRILWRNTHTYNTHTCNTTANDTVAQYEHLQYHSGAIPTPTISTLAVPLLTTGWHKVRGLDPSIAKDLIDTVTQHSIQTPTIPTHTIPWLRKYLCNTTIHWCNMQYHKCNTHTCITKADNMVAQ